MASKLFVFNRAFPEPFDKLKSGSKVSVSSMYGDGTEATLNITMVKAILAYCRCKDGSSPGGVGLIDHRSVVEYASAETDMYHLAIYDSNSGGLMAAVYDTNTELMTQYTVGGKARDGAALAFAMIPFLAKDEEFKDNLNAYFEMHKDGYPDFDKAKETMAILCDNAYRRVGNKECPAYLKAAIDNTGNILRLGKTQLDAGTLEPRVVNSGEFTIFANVSAVPNLVPTTVLTTSDLVDQYKLNPSRVYTDRERSLIPTLPEWYITPDEVVDVCGHALETSGKAMPMRNFVNGDIKLHIYGD